MSIRAEFLNVYHVKGTERDARWEQVAEDFAFVFYSSDLTGRIRYVNHAWEDAVEREIFPEFLPRCSPNRQVTEAFDSTRRESLLESFDLVRRGSASYREELIPSHTNNEHRWTLLRLQRLGEEVVFSFYFLRHYLEAQPTSPKIRCLVDGKSYRNDWRPDASPFDEETARALCPNCSLLFYTFLRQR